MTANGVTPTTAEVATAFAEATADSIEGTWSDQTAAFGRWLAAHERKITARAWEEGWDACMGYVDGPDWGQAPQNPYLEGSNNA